LRLPRLTRKKKIDFNISEDRFAVKMQPWLKGFSVVLCVSAALYGLWWRYSAFLYEGQGAPLSTQILDRMEKEGPPPLEVKDIHAKTHRLADYRGKVIILNFWASWCDPCVQEFPPLIKLMETFKGKVIVLAVSADHTLEDMENFLRAFKVKSEFFIPVWDKDFKLAKQFGTESLPESYIIDGEGKLVKKVAGVRDWMSADALAYFTELTQQ
jgi:thiol-disulfide isomerase/thioredoxin